LPVVLPCRTRRQRSISRSTTARSPSLDTPVPVESGHPRHDQWPAGHQHRTGGVRWVHQPDQRHNSRQASPGWMVSAVMNGWKVGRSLVHQPHQRHHRQQRHIHRCAAFSDCSSLTGVYFQGNAPSADWSVFYNADYVTVYYLPGTTGWGRNLPGVRPSVEPAAAHTCRTSGGADRAGAGIGLAENRIRPLTRRLSRQSSFARRVWGRG